MPISIIFVHESCLEPEPNFGIVEDRKMPCWIRYIHHASELTNEGDIPGCRFDTFACIYITSVLSCLRCHSLIWHSIPVSNEEPILTVKYYIIHSEKKNAEMLDANTKGKLEILFDKRPVRGRHLTHELLQSNPARLLQHCWQNR